MAKRVTTEEFTRAFVNWVVDTFGEPREAAEPAVRLRPEHWTALRMVAERRGVSVTLVLRELVDRWMAEEWARSQQ